MNVQDRFWAKVDKSGECWLWTAAKVRGYGQFATGSMPKLKGAHRAAYEWLVGPIPDGMTLDHTCHNADPVCLGGSTCLHRGCVNPAHMEPIGSGPNVLRGKGPTARNAAKTHCKNGHELTTENAYVKRHGRECRRCARERYVRLSQGIVQSRRGPGIGGRKRTHL